jgi:tRNA (guanine37-N1)-methyltransferase
MTGYDILGNIAVVKFERGMKKAEKLRLAKKLMNGNKQITTVLEKAGKFSGRLRTQKGKYILGEKTKEALYRENGCELRFNVDSCYFSPRLSSERNEIARFVKSGEDVLVMFGGVAPFAIVIAKLSRAKRVVSIELGRDCSKYALENVKRNKLSNVEIIQGDVRKVCPKMKRKGEKFDRIVMARPNLKDDFLDVTFPLIKKGGMIYYYGFYDEDKLNELKELIEKRAKEAKRKVRILKIKKAGDIGIKKYRYRADIIVN